MTEAGLLAAARLLLRWHRERLAVTGRMDMRHRAIPFGESPNPPDNREGEGTHVYDPPH